MSVATFSKINSPIMLPPSANWFQFSVASLTQSGLLAYGANNSVVLVDIVKNKFNAILTDGYDARISSVCFDKQLGALLLSISEDGQAVCWNVRDERCEFRRKLHGRKRSKFIAVDWSSSSSLHQSTSTISSNNNNLNGNFVGIFECGTVISIFVSSTTTTSSSSSSSSTTTTTVSLEENRKLIYRVTTCKLDNNFDQITALACCNNHSSTHRPSGSLAAIGLANGTVAILRLTETTPENLLVTVLARIQHIHSAPIQGLQWHCNSRAQSSCAVCDEVGLLLASSSADGVVVVCNVSSSTTTSQQPVKTTSTTSSSSSSSSDVCELQSVVQLTMPKVAEGRKSWCALAWHPALPLSLVLSGSNGSLLRWRLDSNYCSKFKNIHQRPIFGILFAGKMNDERNAGAIRMVVHSLDRRLTVWDGRVSRLLWQVTGLGGHCTGLSTSRLEPSRMVAAIGDGALRVWNIASARRCLHSLKLRDETKLSFETSATQRRTVQSSGGQLYDVQLLWQGLERAALSSVACHPTQSQLVAFSCTDGKVGVYDLETRHVIMQCVMHKRPVRSLEWRRVSSSSSSAVASLDVDNDNFSSSTSTNTATTSTAATSTSDVYVLYSFGDDGLLMSHRSCCMTELNEPQQQQQQQSQRCLNVTGLYFGAKSNSLSSVTWNNSGRLLAGAYSAGFLSVVLLNSSNDLENTNENDSSNDDDDDDKDSVRKHTTSIEGVVTCLRWLDVDLLEVESDQSINSLLACGCDNGSIVIYSITVNNIATLCTLIGHGGRVEALRWRTCLPFTLLSASADSTAQVWNVQKAIQINNNNNNNTMNVDGDDAMNEIYMSNFREHRGRVLSVCWSASDVDLVFSGSDDQTLRGWYVSSQQHKRPPQSSMINDNNNNKRNSKKRNNNNNNNNKRKAKQNNNSNNNNNNNGDDSE